MSNVNSYHMLENETANSWNFHENDSEFAQNNSSHHHDYYESKMIFTDVSHENGTDTESHCVINDDVSDAISFLGTDTGLLEKTETAPVSIRVVWNLLENVSRVYLPKISPVSEQNVVCLSVKGDPYSVRENGVMLDALNYVRMLVSETSQAIAAF